LCYRVPSGRKQPTPRGHFFLRLRELEQQGIPQAPPLSHYLRDPTNSTSRNLTHRSLVGDPHRGTDPPPHEGYANSYKRSNKVEIRVIAVAETRTEIEKLREQQRFPRDKEILKQGEKRFEDLYKRIKEKMRSEGKLKGLTDTEKELFNNS